MRACTLVALLISPDPALVEVLGRQGRHAEAQVVADGHRRRAEQKGDPRSLARSRRARGAAAALFLSPKTMEHRLRNVYTRLEVSTRSELLERIGSR